LSNDFGIELFESLEHPFQRHDCEIFYSAEIEKYRNLYNDVRSKFTILCGDYEHLKLEHKDEIGKFFVNTGEIPGNTVSKDTEFTGICLNHYRELNTVTFSGIS